jgi:adenine-specific DNA-methyltransferase
MNYIGSKQRLSGFIRETLLDAINAPLSEQVFCDLFAGTGTVGRAFKKEAKKVIANDSEYYSYVLNRNYIGNHRPLSNPQEWMDRLNNLAPQKGFIFQHYCPGGKAGRLYFSNENGQRMDAIRQQIEDWKTQNKISEDLYFFLLASLLEAADRVANTASVYGAYLKQLKKTAQQPLCLVAASFEPTPQPHKVYHADANTLIQKIHGHILYLDPPYNPRQYGANYHLLNTIARYDSFAPRGKTGLRDYAPSAYCSKRQACTVFDHLLQNAAFEYIFLSYNNEGIMSLQEIKNIMQRYGKYRLVKTPYRRFKADKTENRTHNTQPIFEYLHILKK